MIDIKSREVESEPFEPFQKGFDVLFVPLVDFLRGDDPPVFVFQHQHASIGTEGKDFIKVSLSNRLLLMQQFDHLVGRWQRVGDFIYPAIKRRFRDRHLK